MISCTMFLLYNLNNVLFTTQIPTKLTHLYLIKLIKLENILSFILTNIFKKSTHVVLNFID